MLQIVVLFAVDLHKGRRSVPEWNGSTHETVENTEGLEFVFYLDIYGLTR